MTLAASFKPQATRHTACSLALEADEEQRMSNTRKITVTDTILRDAHQSLLATRLRTEDMLPICD